MSTEGIDSGDAGHTTAARFKSWCRRWSAKGLWRVVPYRHLRVSLLGNLRFGGARRRNKTSEPKEITSSIWSVPLGVVVCSLLVGQGVVLVGRLSSEGSGGSTADRQQGKVGYHFVRSKSGVN